MSSIAQCEYDIRRYRTLRSEVSSISSKLNSASDNAETVASDIEKKYQVNDSYTPIVTRTKELRKNINSTSKYLTSKVIPAIDSAIDSLYREIDRLLAEESEYQ